MLDQEPVQDVLAVLRLDGGIPHRVRLATRRLIPLALATADMPALYLDDRHAGPGQATTRSASNSLVRSIIPTEYSRTASSGSCSRSISHTRRSAVRPAPHCGSGGKSAAASPYSPARGCSYGLRGDHARIPNTAHVRWQQLRSIQTVAELKALHEAGMGLIFNDFSSGPAGARDNVLHLAGLHVGCEDAVGRGSGSRPSVRKITFLPWAKPYRG